MHGLLLAYKERERHCDVPTKHEEQGAKLGSWLKRQRQAYKHGTLEAGRVKAGIRRLRHRPALDKAASAPACLNTM